MITTTQPKYKKEMLRNNSAKPIRGKQKKQKENNKDKHRHRNVSETQKRSSLAPRSKTEWVNMKTQ